MTSEPDETIAGLGLRARSVASRVAALDTDSKDGVLRAAAERLIAESDYLIEANGRDLERAGTLGLTATLVDRLRLDQARVEGMALGLRQVADLSDPVGVVTRAWSRPNGLSIQSVRVPLGVVGIIYEGRPNVTSDAFGICLKSGNVAFLRGSSTALESNRAVAEVLRGVLAEHELPTDALLFVDDGTREGAIEFMRQRNSIDCLIPRGGPQLIESVLENSTVPYIIDGDGNCHVYVDRKADLEMAIKVLANSKMQRPSVCNAAESLVVHAEIAPVFLPLAADALEGVELVGDERARALVHEMGKATEDDWYTEYLDLKLSVCVVDDLEEAITHINNAGTGHSEAIVTSDADAAERFVTEVDAAAVLVNASTRFVDGEEFGFGAEIGISTQKLHARGPLGIVQLTTEKFIVQGDGQIRS